MKTINPINHSMKKLNNKFKYEASKRIIFDEEEIKLFKDELKDLLSEVQFTFRDEHIKIFVESIFETEQRDNKIFGDLDDKLNKEYKKAFKILEDYKKQNLENT